MKEMLKLVVSAPRAMAGIDVTKYQESIDKAINEGHTVISLSYLHGAVESTMGYDIAVCLNGELCANVSDYTYKEGIYDVRIDRYNNICKAYLWNSHGRCRGLIVDPTDADDLNYAMKKYSEKSYCL